MPAGTALLPGDPEIVLTAREVQVLRLVADGLYDREIAERLGITYWTTFHYVASILDKLGARTRLEAVVIGIRDGVVPCPRVCAREHGTCALGHRRPLG